ncbi:hypothetical protein GF361_00815 [Candidatus Woesearchaeota archaeon]|nr:hypothetical protein [Candidatus Woesearchaeota archaeon]
MAFLEETGQALLNPLANLWNSFVEVIPGLIGALVVLLFGYLVAWIIGFVIKKLLKKAKLDQMVTKRKTVKNITGKLELSALLGLIVKWYVFVLFLTPAASLVKLPALSTFLNSAALWIPNLIAAVLIALVGLIAADYIYEKISGTKTKKSALIASVTRIIVVVFTLVIALNQMGIDISIAENSLLIIIAGIMLALAIGFGLALGKELRPTVKKMIKKI